MLVQFSQPSTSRRHLRDEEQRPFELHIQPWLDFGLQQAPLASLRSFHLGVRALVIVLEYDALLIDDHESNKLTQKSIFEYILSYFNILR